MRDPFANYDSWLEAPYQRMMDEADQYESALEHETQVQRELLDETTVDQFVQQHGTLICPLKDICTDGIRADGRVHIDLDFLVQTLAEQLATVILAEPPDDEPSDPEDDPRDYDQYWGSAA